MNETLLIILVAIAGAVVFIVTCVLVCVVFGWIDIGLLALFGGMFWWLRGPENPESVWRK